MIFVLLIITVWFVLSWERRARRNFGSLAYVTLLAFSIVTLYAVTAVAQRQQKSVDIYRVVTHGQETLSTK
jgi:hypothetical protein